MKNTVTKIEKIEKDVIPKGAPVIIPNVEELSKEEIEKIRHRERMRRYMARRKGGQAVKKLSRQEVRTINTNELVEISKNTRNLALQVLNKKLTDIFYDDKDKTNLATLATVFGILFDKSQIMNGMATQNIAIQAKIDVNMSSKELMAQLGRIREAYKEDSVSPHEDE